MTARSRNAPRLGAWSLLGVRSLPGAVQLLGSVLLLGTVLLLGACSSVTRPLGDPAPGTALWRGSWDSDVVWTVGGEVATHLPDPLPNEPFEAPAAIRYGLLSVYRRNDVVRTSFRGGLAEDDRSRGDNAAAPIADAPVTTKFLMTAVAPGSEQVITYEARLSDDGTRLVGTYASEAPYDEGTFELRRR